MLRCTYRKTRELIFCTLSPYTTNSALSANMETVLFSHNPCKSCANSICAGFFYFLEYVSLEGNFWSLCTTTNPSYCSNPACQNRTPPTMTVLSVTGRIFGYSWSNFQFNYYFTQYKIYCSLFSLNTTVANTILTKLQSAATYFSRFEHDLR